MTKVFREICQQGSAMHGNLRTLRIDFLLYHDRETPVSSKSRYYNLNGHQSSIKNHTIQLDANEITSIHHDFTATGDFESVINSYLDLNHEKSVSKALINAKIR